MPRDGGMVAEALVEAGEQTQRELGLSGLGRTAGEAGHVVAVVELKRRIKRETFAGNIDGAMRYALRKKYRNIHFPVRGHRRGVVVVSQPVAVFVMQRRRCGLRGKFLAQQGSCSLAVASRARVRAASRIGRAGSVCGTSSCNSRCPA